MAAQGISGWREFEKDKLTQINVNRQRIKDETSHLQNSLKKDI